MKRFSRGIFILFDGSRPDIFEKLLKKEKLPNIKKYLLPSGNILNAVGAFPSLSGPAHLPFMTGMFPGNLNIPGIYWFDREAYGRGGINFKKFRSYLGPFKILKMNHDIPKNVPSIFEIFPDGAGIFVWFNRGGGRYRNLTRFKKAFSFLRGVFTKEWLSCDEDAKKAMFKAIDLGCPFIFAILPATDELGHRFGPLNPEVETSYINLDTMIGEIFEKLKNKNFENDTLIVVAGDHSHSPTHTHINLEGFVENRIKNTMTYKRFPSHYFNADAVCFPCGNAMANLYFKGNGWLSLRPDMSDRSKVWGKIVDEIKEIEGVDILSYRNKEGGIIVESKRGKAKVSIINGNIIYDVLSDDPFGYKSLPEKMTFEEELQLTFDTDYPDALVNLTTIFNAKRSGDLIVTAYPGYDLRVWWEYQEAYGSHGSLHREHCIVPVLTNADSLKSPMRTVDIFSTILYLLGMDIPQGVDGVVRVI